MNILKKLWMTNKECGVHGPWYKARRKHLWAAHYNKHGTMYRRSCYYCGAYQDRRNGKWHGYGNMKMPKHMGQGVLPPGALKPWWKIW